MEVKRDRPFDEVCSLLIEPVKSALLAVDPCVKSRTQEIRLRAGRPVHLCAGAEEYFLRPDGKTTTRPQGALYIPSLSEVYDVFRALCDFSIHTHQAQAVEGFLTLRGGHRAGLCATAVSAGKEVTGIRDLSSINIRIARQIEGAANELLRHYRAERGLLIAGPPGCGKTTVLRDLARQLGSSAASRIWKITIVDERGEIAAVHRGIPQNDVGVCTDVLDGYSKERGIEMALRTLSPEIILCDEIGREQDIEAIEKGICCGAVVIATLHAQTAKEALNKPFVQRLRGTGAFEELVVLEGRGAPGRIQSIVKLGDCNDEAAGGGTGDFSLYRSRDNIFRSAETARKDAAGAAHSV